MGKIYGYIRVSTREQNEDRQRIALASFDIPPKRLYIDRKSGKDFDRPAYQRLKKKLRSGDLIVTKSIDRFGRNYEEIMEEWKIISKDIGADICVIDMPLLDTRQNKDLLGTFISDLVLQILSFVSETERSYIKQRQAEGIAAAKLKGIRFGRPTLPIPDNYSEVVRKWKDGNISSRAAAKELQVSQTTLLKWTKNLKDYPKLQQK